MHVFFILVIHVSDHPQVDQPRRTYIVLVPPESNAIRLIDYVGLSFRLGDNPEIQCEIWDQSRDEWTPSRLGDPINVHWEDGAHVLVRMPGVKRCFGLEDALWFAHDGPL